PYKINELSRGDILAALLAGDEKLAAEKTPEERAAIDALRGRISAQSGLRGEYLDRVLVYLLRNGPFESAEKFLEIAHLPTGTTGVLVLQGLDLPVIDINEATVTLVHQLGFDWGSAGAIVAHAKTHPFKSLEALVDFYGGVVSQKDGEAEGAKDADDIPRL